MLRLITVLLTKQYYTCPYDFQNATNFAKLLLYGTLSLTFFCKLHFCLEISLRRECLQYGIYSLNEDQK